MYVKDSPTERVKLMTLFAGEEDFELARSDLLLCVSLIVCTDCCLLVNRAASGALAMLTTNKRICEKMMEVCLCGCCCCGGGSRMVVLGTALS